MTSVLTGSPNPVVVTSQLAKAAAHDLPGDVEHALVAVQYEVDVCGEDDAVQLERDRVRVLRRV